MISVAAGPACAAPSDDAARRAELLRELAEQNQVFWARDPGLTAGKLRRMQGAPHAWMRGTAGVYWRDLAGPGPWAEPTACADARADRVLLIGDPHLENLGSFRAADGAMTFDWNDFDAASYGPYWGDVRRLAVAAIIGGLERFGDRPERWPELARAVAAGYAGEITAAGDGAEPSVIAGGVHPFVDELIEDAIEDGDEAEKLEDYTDVDAAGVRAMFYGDVDPPLDDGTFDDTVVEARGAEPDLARLVEAWRATAAARPTREQAAIKGTSRRLGAGTASYPALRYYVLLEGPSAEPGDDWLLELKETADPPAMFGPDTYGPLFASNAARVVAAQRTTAAIADADVLLGWADLAPMSFRVRERTGYQRGTDLPDLMEELAAGDAGDAQLVAFAELAGRLLARAHLRGETASGAAPIDAIGAAIDGRADVFADETADFAVRYAERVLADWELFAGEGDLAAEVFP
jgi:uncharacterized protein (DUF2252 family)